MIVTWRASHWWWNTTQYVKYNMLQKSASYKWNSYQQYHSEFDVGTRKEPKTSSILSINILFLVCVRIAPFSLRIILACWRWSMRQTQTLVYTSSYMSTQSSSLVEHMYICTWCMWLTHTYTHADTHTHTHEGTRTQANTYNLRDMVYIIAAKMLLKYCFHKQVWWFLALVAIR